jgi:hypothetical protein
MRDRETGEASAANGLARQTPSVLRHPSGKADRERKGFGRCAIGRPGEASAANGLARQTQSVLRHPSGKADRERRGFG